MSSRRPDEWKVVATMAVFTVVLEVAASLSGPALGPDRTHIHAIPAIAEGLHGKPAPRVLVLGNSLTMWGVDMDRLQHELTARHPAEVHLGKVYPVGTDLVDFHYLPRRYFTDPGLAPDVVVVGFVAHHIDDRPAKRHRRLGRHFTSLQAMPELFSHELLSFERRAENVLSHLFASFGDQLLWKEIILHCVPEMPAGSRDVDRKLERIADALAESRGEAPTFHRLERYMELLRGHGVDAIFVAMPLPEVWDMDQKLPRTVRDAGMTFVDARSIEGLTPAHYQDGYHLAADGAAIYSRFLAARIAERLR